MGLTSWLRRNAKAETRDAETGMIPVAEPLFSALMGEGRLAPDMAMEIPAFSASVDFISSLSLHIRPTPYDIALKDLVA